MSNSLDPDQDRHYVGPDLVPTVCNGYQQTTKVATSRLRVKEVLIFYRCILVTQTWYDVYLWTPLVSGLCLGQMTTQCGYGRCLQVDV